MFRSRKFSKKAQELIQQPSATPRVFLFLQGPHGPFFQALGRGLEKAGARVFRVGFNAGDRAFWRDRASYLPYRGTLANWPGHFETLLRERSVTDLVLYGDTRPIHADAIRAARRKGVRIHVFEEGYLRPYWVSYERGGANGHSALMNMSIDRMRAQLASGRLDRPVPPCHWGDTRQHVFYGAAYHWCVMFLNHAYRHFTPHRALNVRQEFRLHLRRLLMMPFHGMERWLATRRISTGRFPYHVALLQLEHDSSFQKHSPFRTQCDFIREVIDGFRIGAPMHHHLVFKAHPLEDGRTPLKRDIERLAREQGISDRVHFVRGGKLARLLGAALSAVTVNSTAGQQVLWRGLPLRIFGRAVYGKAELVSCQPLCVFFAQPRRPDREAYADFRDYLLSTSQLPGSYYAARGRAQLLRTVVDRMLDARDPYALTQDPLEAKAQQLRLVN